MSKKTRRASADRPPPEPYVRLRVLSASNVFVSGRAANACVRLTLGKRQLTTAVLKNNPDPAWNEDFFLPVTDPETEELELQLCDAVKGGKKARDGDMVGGCKIRLSGLVRDVPQAFALQLQMLRPDCVTTLNVIAMPFGFGQNLTEQFLCKEQELRDQLQMAQSDSWALLVSQFLRQQVAIVEAERQRREAELRAREEEERRRKAEAERQLREEEERKAQEELMRWDREPFDPEHARQAFVRRLLSLDLGDAAPDFHSRLAKGLDKLVKKHMATGQATGYVNHSQWLIDAPNDPEAQVRVWIETLLQTPCNAPSMHAWLQNGQVLCHLVNAISPAFIEPSTIHDSDESMQHRANIRQFVTSCKQLGVDETDTFLVDDLYRNKDMKQVYICIKALSNAARYVRGFEGPFIEKLRSHVQR